MCLRAESLLAGTRACPFPHHQIWRITLFFDADAYSTTLNLVDKDSNDVNSLFNHADKRDLARVRPARRLPQDQMLRRRPDHGV